MDPISAGALKNVQQSVVEQAEQQIQKSNQSISDFEKLRQKLEDQDAISNLQQTNQTNAPDQLDPSQKIDAAQKNEQVDQTNPGNFDLSVQKLGEVPGVAGIPEVKGMGELESTINHIRGGQARLNDLISQALSGKTYSPQEMLAMQAEIGRITNDLEMSVKILDSVTQGLKTALNMQL